jgi:hypothetical protein
MVGHKLGQERHVGDLYIYGKQISLAFVMPHQVMYIVKFVHQAAISVLALIYSACLPPKSA